MKGPLLTFAAALTVLAGAVSHTSARSPASVNDAAIFDGMPRALSEFRFFTVPSKQVSTTAVPYELNTPLYSDGAEKLRFIYVPNGEVLKADGDGLLEFPVGSAIIKTFAFGEGAERQLIETRVLLHRADGWLALPYRWNAEQTDATLALAGARLPITRPDGSEISYRIPNKNQCKTCHSKDGEVIPIGPKARNLSREFLTQLVDAERMVTITENVDTLPDWNDRAHADTANLARAYLDVNCAHCHQPGGSASNSGLDLRWEQDDPHAIGIRKPPVAAGRGSGGHLVSIAPGNPDASILIHRMSSTEPGVAMPELGKGTVDEDGVAMLRKWIEGMPTS
ncbi:SO2930 family diheme c-type cytochrome [uncultured Erythrobacter sp.]|uniref:SO2930 family diheme c-type cytochrome n=1 Tax=uncultured Erythrobacter sp. TaxID=263913 RepID=UPI0026284F57|nr:SO2930 family diheme c-type cytochrome [uncultured Erythrobacter sp.]